MFTGITSVASNAFIANTAFVSCKLPINATMIKDGAFSGCTALSSINLDHVVDIGRMAFLTCSNLKIELNLPYLEAIGYRGFQESGIMAVNNLGHITELPDGHSNYAYGVFAGCASLETVVLPDTLTKIGAKCFLNCSKLKSITIPANVSVLGYSAFNNAGLEEVTINSSEIVLSGNTFAGCVNLVNVKGIESITSISGGDFGSCSNLKEVINMLN